MNSHAQKFAVVATVLVVASAHGQLQNGSFEESGGTFAHWTRIGDTQIQGSSIGSGPLDGTHQALLATATDGSVNTDVPAGAGVTVAAMESGLGIGAGTLADPGIKTQFASGISQTLNLVTGQKVSFSFDFLTNQAFPGQSPDPANNDYAFVFLATPGSPITIATLADTFTPNVETPFSDPFIGETGYGQYSLTASATGTYTFALGVVHAPTGTDNGINSALLVDDIKVGAVPEPSSVFALGGLFLCVLRRRSRKQ